MHTYPLALSLAAVESTEGILEIWFREPFPRWGSLRFRVRVRVHPSFVVLFLSCVCVACFSWTRGAIHVGGGDPSNALVLNTRGGAPTAVFYTPCPLNLYLGYGLAGVVAKGRIGRAAGMLRPSCNLEKREGRSRRRIVAVVYGVQRKALYSTSGKLGLYTILPWPILYGVSHAHGGVGRGSYIAR